MHKAKPNEMFKREQFNYNSMGGQTKKTTNNRELSISKWNGINNFSYKKNL